MRHGAEASPRSVDRAFERSELPAREAARRIARAVALAVTLGADVIQLSLEFSTDTPRPFLDVVSALHAAAAKGVCAVIAAGNSASLGSSPVLAAPGVVRIRSATPIWPMSS